MRHVPSLAAFFLTTSVATAGPALPADKHEPPVWTDPTAIWFQIRSQSDESYQVQSSFRVYGATSKTDRVRLDIKQGNKVVGTASCTSQYDETTKQLWAGCTTEKYLKTAGAHTYELIYTDDQTDKDYLVTTLKADVKRWKGIGKTIEWGYTPDDILALAYVRHVDDSGYPKLANFEIWTTAELAGSELVFRCTVDGKKLPDFEGSANNHINSDQDTIRSSWTTEKVQKVYEYRKVGLEMVRTHWGMRPADETALQKAERYLGENPGKWDCMVRKDGKPVRQFMFTVNDKGMVEPSELQTGSKNVKIATDEVMIDMRIPKDNGVEKRIRQDSLKKSVGWGLPWPDSPKAKEAQAAFPPTMGTPD